MGTTARWRDAMSGIVTALRGARSVTLATHINPDADGIASCLAVDHALRARGVATRLLCPGPLADRYAFLPGVERFRVLDDEAKAKRRKPCEVLFSLDCADEARLGAVAHLRRKVLLNVDHHASNDRFGDRNLVDPHAACTGMVVERLLKRLRWKIDLTIATCLYASIVYDTGRFMHANTDAAVFRFAGRMAAKGVDIAAVNRHLTYHLEERDLRLTHLGIERLVRDRRDPRLAGISLDHAAIAAVGAPDDWGDLVDLPRSLRGVEIAYLIREFIVDGKPVVRCSLRANPPYAVGPVAARFGGGGHVLAAGCTIEAGLAVAKRKVLKALREQLGKNPADS